MQNHRQFARYGDDGSLLATFAARRGQLQSPAAQRRLRGLNAAGCNGVSVAVQHTVMAKAKPQLLYPEVETLKSTRPTGNGDLHGFH